MHIWLIIFIVFTTLVSCNDSSFSGISTQKTRPGTSTVDEVILTIDQEKVGKLNPEDEGNTSDTDTGTGGQEDPFIPTFVLTRSVTPILDYKNRSFWVVTTSGHAYHIKLKDNAPEIAETKHWTFSGGGCGIRTYVSEAGLVFGRCGGGGPFVYTIDPDNTPVESNITSSWSSGGSGSRACIASYSKDNKKYVGFGWNGGNSGRMFTEIPMTDTKPYQILFDQAKNYDAGTGAWAYNCNIDQTNLIYYGAQGYATPIYGFDLKQLKEIDPATTIKNAGFKSTNLTSDEYTDPATKSGGGFPYSISGDPFGNVFTGYSYTYTFTEDYTHEKNPRMVWRSSKHWSAPYNGDSKIGVYPHECFFKTQLCENYKSYTPEEMGIPGIFIGPISSIGKGEIIGLTRNQSAAQAYLFKLKDPVDATGGVVATKLGEFVGDPYMYTDFTGSTLYVSSVLTKFDLLLLPEFLKNIPISALTFSFIPQNKALDLSGIVAEARCYLSSDPNFPEFKEIGSLEKGNIDVPITVESCQGYFEEVEISLHNTKGLFDPSENNQITIKIKQKQN